MHTKPMRIERIKMRRRHLNRQVSALPFRARRRVAAEFILMETEGGLTDTRIAQALGINAKTIGKWRRQLPDGVLNDALVKEGVSGRMIYPHKTNGDTFIISREEVDLLKPIEDALAIYEEQPGALERPEIRMFQDNPHWKTRTVRVKKAALNKIARLLGFDGYDDPAMPWWKLTKKEHALAIVELLKQDPTVNRSFTVYLNALKDLYRAQWSIDSRRVNADELKKVEMIKAPRKTTPRKQARIPEVSEWIQVASGYDLTNPAHWMNLAQLVLAFPCGLRPIDIAGILDKSYMHLDDGYIRLWREKTETSGGVAMVDCYPGVRMVLRHWLSMIPDEVNHVWFRQDRKEKKLAWDDPILPEHSNLIGRKITTYAKKYGIHDFKAYCGRHSYRTFATVAGVPEWIILLNGGWEQKGASWGYFDAKIGDMRGAFANVPEFIEFDNALIEIVFPHLQGKQLSLADMLTVVVERRKCSECGKLLPEGARVDKLTCGATCRQRRKARIDAHT